MRGVVEQYDLVKGINKLQALISKKSTMPILAYYVLQLRDGFLHLSGTDLEVSVTLRVAAENLTEGAVAVPGKMFGDVIRQLPAGGVSLYLLDDNRLEIKSSTSRFRLKSVSASAYPSIPGLSLGAFKSISASLLVDMLNKVLYAASTDPARFNLSGVCIETAYDGCLRFVATDGHRLAMVSREIPCMGVVERRIVPRKGLSESRRALEEIGELSVGFEFHENFLILEGPDFKIAIRLLDVEFPDYSKVVPSQSGFVGTVNTQGFADALRRMSLMVTDQGRNVRLDVSAAELRISSSSPELGEGEEFLSLDYRGEPVSLGFNVRFLSDVANCFQGGEGLIMEFSGESEATRFYSVGDESALAVVMPVRLD